MDNCLIELKKLNNGAKLSLPKGNYTVLPTDTSEEFIYVSNNDASLKKIFINLKNLKDVSIDFCGSTLEFKGRITPFYIDNCQNVSIKNVNVKFSRHYYFQAKIKKIDGKKMFIEPTGGDDFSVENGRIILNYGDEVLDYGNKTVFIQEFETEPIRVAKKSGIRITSLGDLSGKAEAYSFSEDGLAVESNVVPPFKAGNTICFFCEQRISDAFVINESKNVLIENVNIYNSPAMGVIAQASENLKLVSVNVIRDEKDKHIITSLADATHFTNCRGKVGLYNCTFENMNDDGTNIHGMYTVVSEVHGNTVDVKFKHFQQYGVKIYRVGDKIAFLDKDNKTRKFVSKICRVESISEQVTRLTFGKELPVTVGDVVENITAMPKVEIVNCKTGGNRPRGFLVATNKKAVVKKCKFYNSECGIGVFADTDYWFESGAVKDINVKDCEFLCNYGGETSAISVRPSVKKAERCFNGKISVKNCKFSCDYGNAVVACNTEKLILKNNYATVRGEKVNFSEKVQLID